MDLPSEEGDFWGYTSRTEIEERELEKEVFKRLTKGQTIQTISRELKVTKRELERFIEKSKKALKIIEEKNKEDTSRLVLAKAECEEMLTQTVSFIHHLVRKYDEAGDNKSTVAALRTLNDTIMNYAKLAGYLKEENKTEGKVIDVVSERNKHLVDRLKRGIEFGRGKEQVSNSSENKRRDL